MRRLLLRNFHRVYRLDRWVRRHFTRPGIFVLASLVATGVAGVDMRRSLAHQIFALLLALLSLAIASGSRFRGRFSVHRTLPRFATVDEPVRYRVKMHNLTHKTQRGLFIREVLDERPPSVEEFRGSRAPGEERYNRVDQIIGYPRWTWLMAQRRGAEVQEHPLPVLLPDEAIDVTLTLTPKRRGYIHLVGTTIARPDPFGVYKSLVGIAQPQQLLVLPKRYRVPHVPLSAGRHYQPGGVNLASSVGDSQEFISLRDYHPGDPLRHIHWRSWAKTGKPIVKEYQEEFFARYALVLDTFLPRGYSLVFEEAVSVAASFAATLDTQDTLLDLMFVGPKAYTFTVGRSLAHTDQMLEILACVEVSPEQPFQRLHELVLSQSAQLSGCICILVDWDEARRQLVAMLNRLGIDAVILLVMDPVRPPPSLPVSVHPLKIGRITEDLARL
jgi:uncharacterized protein (DUF58 family)